MKPTPELIAEWTSIATKASEGMHEVIEKVAELAAAWGATQAQQTTEPGFWLSTEYINDFVVNSLKDLIRRAKQCSICDVDLRENGKNVHFEADWIKYMEWRDAAPSIQQTTVEPELPEAVAWRWMYQDQPDSERCFNAPLPNLAVLAVAESAEFRRTVQAFYTATQMHAHFAAGVRAGAAQQAVEIEHKDALLRQALEALESIDIGYRSSTGLAHEVSFNETACNEAIAAIKTHLGGV